VGTPVEEAFGGDEIHQSISSAGRSLFGFGLRKNSAITINPT
jgi:hypothetical protein